MVGRTDVARCCCGCEVVLSSVTRCWGDWYFPGDTYFDAFGGFAVGVGEYVTGDDDAKILFDRKHTAGSWRLVCAVEAVLKPTATAATSAFEVRVIGGNEETDDSSSSSSESTSSSSVVSTSSSSSSSSSVSSSSSSSSRAADPYCERDGAYMTLGYNATLGEYARLHDQQMPRNAGCGEFTSDSFSATMVLCWNGSRLVASLHFGRAEATIFTLEGTLQTTDMIPTGDRFGLQVTVKGSEVRFIRFSNVTLYRVDEECGDCNSHCCDGDVPANLQLEVEFGASTFQNRSAITFNQCYYGDCDDAGGTFVLPNRSLSTGGDPRCLCGGDHCCRWYTSGIITLRFAHADPTDFTSPCWTFGGPPLHQTH